MNDSRIRDFELFTEGLMEYSSSRCLALRAVSKDGRILYENYYGYRDEDKRLRPDRDTIFGLASVTKSFTALSVMKLQEEGKLSVDDEISSYVPCFRDPSGMPPVRIRHFLSHTGGFFPKSRILTENVAESLGIKDSLEHELIYDKALLDEGLRLVATRLSEDHSRLEAPGKLFSYCNDGFGILSEIVRMASGYDSFAGYVEKEILEPLGMKRSTMSFIRPALDSNAAVLYTEENGTLTCDRNYLNDAFVLNGGGAMKSTISDLTEYLLMYLNSGVSGKGIRIAGKSSIDEMMVPRIYVSPGVSYCYGLEESTYGDVRYIEHGGSLPGVSSVIAFSPEREIGITVLSNTMGVPVSAVARKLFSVLSGIDTDSKGYEKSSYSDYILKNSEGIYHSDEGDTVEVKRDGDLLLIFRNGKQQDHMSISPVSGIIEGRYTDTFFEFITDDRRGIYALRFGSRIFPRTRV
ncbi:MAG: serine hydrolase [Clostridia bacterium]|nr:serine hydrolase [Clostridia bacterium]